MKKAKQIEEMALELCRPRNIVKMIHHRTCDNCDTSSCDIYELCVDLYNAGYRKQSEGEWEKFEGERFICSNCAKVFGLGSTATIHDVKRVWNFCPNCGAKMKGG